MNRSSNEVLDKSTPLAYIIFGFHVSGAGHNAALIVTNQGGPVAWTGGAWGPEGGLIGLLALLAGTLAIVAWVRFTRGAVRLQEKLAVYQLPASAPNSGIS